MARRLGDLPGGRRPRRHHESEAKKIWTSHQTFVAEVDGRIYGSSYLKPNQPVLGDHVANAGFMVASSACGKGVGRKLRGHAIRTAREEGYQAMQFNFVVSTNQSTGSPTPSATPPSAPSMF